MVLAAGLPEAPAAVLGSGTMAGCYAPIGEYRVIGDLYTVALVGMDGKHHGPLHHLALSPGMKRAQSDLRGLADHLLLRIHDAQSPCPFPVILTASVTFTSRRENDNEWADRHSGNRNRRVRGNWGRD